MPKNSAEARPVGYRQKGCEALQRLDQSECFAQSTTPVLLCTAKYYSSTILYYKVLLRYYSVLQSTTPVLLCTTKYYTSTTLYCKVLLCTTKYYSVLQSTTTALYYQIPLVPLQSEYVHVLLLSHMKRHFQCAEAVKSPSNFTKYCACHEILKLKISAEIP